MIRKMLGLRCLAVLLTVLAMSCCVFAAPGVDQEKAGPPVAAATQAQRTPTIGIIGGVSWVSSAEYYRLMNEMVRDQLGGLHSAQVLMFSIEFGEFSKQERLADRGDWTTLIETMVDAAQRLKQGGADFIVIASNTLNSQAELIEKRVGIPVLHIADATGEAVHGSGLRKVALLGTKYTMEQPFYRDHLAKAGVQVVIPNEREREYINTVIFDELCAGQFKDASRQEFVRIIERLAREEGAQGVILGCTEIPLLVSPKDVDIPVFDTTRIHSAAAVKRALAGAQ